MVHARFAAARPAAEVVPLLVLGFVLLDRPSAIAFAVVVTGLRVLGAALAADVRPDGGQPRHDDVAVAEMAPTTLDVDTA